MKTKPWQVASFVLVVLALSVNGCIADGDLPVICIVSAPMSLQGTDVVFSLNLADDEQCRTGTCSWDFGDGSTSNSCNVRHAFQQSGDYLIKARADGSCGKTFETEIHHRVLAVESSRVSTHEAVDLNDADLPGRGLALDTAGRPHVLYLDRYRENTHPASWIHAWREAEQWHRETMPLVDESTAADDWIYEMWRDPDGDLGVLAFPADQRQGGIYFGAFVDDPIEFELIDEHFGFPGLLDHANSVGWAFDSAGAPHVVFLRSAGECNEIVHAWNSGERWNEEDVESCVNPVTVCLSVQIGADDSIRLLLGQVDELDLYTRDSAGWGRVTIDLDGTCSSCQLALTSTGDPRIVYSGWDLDSGFNSYYLHESEGRWVQEMVFEKQPLTWFLIDDYYRRVQLLLDSSDQPYVLSTRFYDLLLAHKSQEWRSVVVRDDSFVDSFFTRVTVDETDQIHLITKRQEDLQDQGEGVRQVVRYFKFRFPE